MAHLADFFLRSRNGRYRNGCPFPNCSPSSSVLGRLEIPVSGRQTVMAATMSPPAERM